MRILQFLLNFRKCFLAATNVYNLKKNIFKIKIAAISSNANKATIGKLWSEIKSIGVKF